MSMTQISNIVFTRERYGNNREKMFEAVAKQLALLMENEYVCKVYDDDRDIIVIEFEQNQRRDWLGCPELMWLEPEEVELVEQFRLDKENDTE